VTCAGKRCVCVYVCLLSGACGHICNRGVVLGCKLWCVSVIAALARGLVPMTLRAADTKPNPSGGCSGALLHSFSARASSWVARYSFTLAPRCPLGERRLVSASPPLRRVILLLTDCSGRQIDTTPRRGDFTESAPQPCSSRRVAPTNQVARRHLRFCASKRAAPARSCA
jgi:hypothetical protein